jgi:tripartite ATP-independent transporter DctM subunit
MEWWVTLIIVFGSIGLLIAIRLPVAFAFLLVNLIGSYLILGGTGGLEQVALSITTSISSFVLLSIPLFVFLGEVTFHSGMGAKAIDALGAWLGRLPGRLSVLAVGSAALFAALSGSALATTAMLGKGMAPEMIDRGYHKSMIVGPIISSGSLAMIIPPSGVAILLGALARISIGKLLISGLIPGLIMAFSFIAYIVYRCWMNPSLAPSYDISSISLTEKVKLLIRYVLPLGLIFFMAVIIIFLGIATPSEAAALACVVTVILAVSYRKFNLSVLKKSIYGTLRVSVMIFMILSGSITFSQILAFAGCTQGLVELVTGLQIAPIFVLILMETIVILLGCLIDQASIIMISIPIFMPIVNALGFDPIAFGLLILICVEMGNITPPFGMGLFVMKSVAPAEINMGDIYRSVIPFLFVELIVIVLITIIPKIATWLPGLMKT